MYKVKNFFLRRMMFLSFILASNFYTYTQFNRPFLPSIHAPYRLHPYSLNWSDKSELSEKHSIYNSLDLRNRYQSNPRIEMYRPIENPNTTLSTSANCYEACAFQGVSNNYIDTTSSVQKIFYDQIRGVELSDTFESLIYPIDPHFPFHNEEFEHHEILFPLSTLPPVSIMEGEVFQDFMPKCDQEFKLEA